MGSNSEASDPSCTLDILGKKMQTIEDAVRKSIRYAQNESDKAKESDSRNSQKADGS